MEDKACEFCGCGCPIPDRPYPIPMALSACSCPCHFVTGRDQSEIDAFRRAVVKYHGAEIRKLLESQ